MASFRAMLLIILLPSFTTVTASTFEYNVCNGLTNQLLIHASAIARAIEGNTTVIRVPDIFIVNGIQTSEQLVLPAAHNSVPLGQVFDMGVLQQRLQQLGIRMELNCNTKQLDCPGLSWLSRADPQLVLQILQAFQPAPLIQSVTEKVLGNLPRDSNHQGICLHHRDGQDWHDHCKRWSALQAVDGIYRGNCLAPEKELLTQLLQNRALHTNSNETKRWIYYTGDHHIPNELLALQQNQNTLVVQKKQFLSSLDEQAIQALGPNGAQAGIPNASIRDLWALVDFFICAKLPYFVGNSVSTFSALQIAIRNSKKAYWYNSQSIPLAGMWNIYQIPIVYTYTELSDIKGKHMLQASIVSLRQHMPHNKVYVLYHGQKDTAFRHWLQDQQVTIFSHNPHWKDSIESLRSKGNPKASHLFEHAGNYFGTWQRIDIPQFLETEYVLLLDADTIIFNPFTLRDLGLNLTRSIAMCGEQNRDHVGKHLLNAGVMLMNVPTLRQTHHSFLQFILNRDAPTFNNNGPSDQGAYLEFYQDSLKQMPKEWNWKGYWRILAQNEVKQFEKIKIVHFHGLKPHDYVRTEILRLPCKNGATRELCQSKRLHKAFIQRFLQAGRSIDPHFYSEYCLLPAGVRVQRQERCVAALDQLYHRPRQSSSENQDLGVTVSPPKERTAEERAKELTAINKPRELSFWNLTDEQFPLVRSLTLEEMSQFQMTVWECGVTSMLLLFCINRLRKSRRRRSAPERSSHQRILGVRTVRVGRRGRQ